MVIDATVIERIDATLLPQMDPHHLRLLVHCLESFRAMDRAAGDALPDAASRRRWCEQQPVVAEEASFLRSLLHQLDAAAEQLQSLADHLNKAPLQLSLDDLISAAEARCHHQIQTGRADEP